MSKLIKRTKRSRAHRVETSLLHQQTLFPSAVLIYNVSQQPPNPPDRSHACQRQMSQQSGWPAMSERRTSRTPKCHRLSKWTRPANYCRHFHELRKLRNSSFNVMWRDVSVMGRKEWWKDKPWAALGGKKKPKKPQLFLGSKSALQVNLITEVTRRSGFKINTYVSIRSSIPGFLTTPRCRHAFCGAASRKF